MIFFCSFLCLARDQSRSEKKKRNAELRCKGHSMRPDPNNIYWKTFKWHYCNKDDIKKIDIKDGQ